MIDGDMEKRRLWARVLESRQQKGLPYIMFTDNANRNRPQVYKDKDYAHSLNATCASEDYCYLLAKKNRFICCCRL